MTTQFFPKPPTQANIDALRWHYNRMCDLLDRRLVNFQEVLDAENALNMAETERWLADLEAAGRLNEVAL